MSSKLDILVLGSAAGGGSPQWNCRCAVCARVRAGGAGTAVRTQCSLAVSADGGKRWVLLGASPDLGHQLAGHAAFLPRVGRRHSPISAVVLANSEVDHIAGLLSMREGHGFGLYATAATHAVLERSAIFKVLDTALVSRRVVDLEVSTPLIGIDGASIGMSIEAFSVPGKVALHEEQAGQTPSLGELGEQVVGLKVSAGEKYFFFIPGCAAFTPELGERLGAAPLVFFDGTLWDDEELVRQELSSKSGRRMGHMCIDGANGSLAYFSGVEIGRKVFIHLNNSNPVLLADSPERNRVEAAGWEVAYDSMVLHL
ncbi:MAG: pyrroloquinoline quinone biosynthesis protein PqqB [Bradymonadaceae bacterium]|nr:pyrroloquinoline quinone biosynthesis protein PqqB [Lujinxingiaceae bacterium]